MDDDIVMTWVRRDRLGDELVVGPQQLSESAELYDVEILTPDGVSVVRTIIDLTAPTYTYTATNQSDDGLDYSPSVRFRVYQKSVPLGRGFAREEIVDVN
jgi:hypothetical protein